MKKLYIKLVLISLVGLALFAFLGSFVKKIPEDDKNIQTVVSSTAQPQKNSTANLGKAIENTLIDAEGTYGIAIKNLKTGESYYYNEHQFFEAASLYKLWVLVTAFDQIEKETLKEDDMLSQNVAVLNKKFHISSESAELTEGRVTLTVKEAIDKMITISDNYSALLLSERIRLAAVTAFLKENNFNESFIGEPPKTSSYDTALFFEKLYKGELANQENTGKMLDILKRQTRNSKLPKYLPEGVLIAHKTGEIGYFSHDVGIIFTSNGDYVIAILSKSKKPSQANEQIAKISQEVYNYFTKESEN